jgi:hypothetical protein
VTLAQLVALIDFIFPILEPSRPMNVSPQITSKDLRQAVRLQQQIEKLESKLHRLLGKTKRNGLSAARSSVPRNISAEGTVLTLVLAGISGFLL